jgi:hypothetical protein
MRRLIARFLGASILIAGLVVIPAAPVAAHNDDNPLAAVRHATAKYHDVNRAVADGFGSLLPCFDLPGVGGMGQHYVKPPLAKLNPTQPEALVYEVHGDELTLVAVEYIVPQATWTSSKPPRLFGQWFLRNDTLGLWTLHAWIWRSNPLGTFASYNPEVDMCPGHQSE